MGAFCEPAVGSVQFRALHEALISVNYKGLAIIEQDMYPVDFDKPLGIARRSRAYYESVGFGS